MGRAVTAIYRSYATATLVRDELERLGIGRRQVTIIPDEEARSTSASPTTVSDTTGMVGTTAGTGGGGGYVGTTPRYADAASSYTDADARYGDAFNDLRGLHLPESDMSVYQQAIRNGDYVVSVDVDDDADLARIQEIMRRPEDAYEPNELDTRYSTTGYTSGAGSSIGGTAGASGDVATDETGSLIAASKVNGTNVYNRQGESLGSIYDVMIDKRSGQVAYAVMSFGGFLGMGDSYHPLPWSVLTYDTTQGGYVVDLDRERLQGAPTYSASDTSRWSDRSYTGAIDDYYGVTRYGL